MATENIPAVKTSTIKGAKTANGNEPVYHKPSLWKQVKTNKVSYLMMSPYLILFTLFTIVPILASLFLSFTYFNMLEMPEWRGLINYQHLLLDDEVFWIAVKNTLIFAFLTGPLSYVLCFIFAWFINDLPKKLRTFMTLVFYAPSISSSIYFIWSFIFSGDIYGMVNGFLIKLGIIHEPILWLQNPTFNMPIIIVIQLWLSLGVSFLSFIAGFQTIDRSLYEAGAIDGVRNRFQELFYITIPAMKPQMLFGAVMQIALSFAVGPVPQALGGFPSTNYSLHTVITHIYDYGSVRFEMGYASAIAFLLAVVMIVVKNVITKALSTD